MAQKRGGNNGRRGSNNKGGNQQHIKCNKCGKNGHKADKCRRQAKNLKCDNCPNMTNHTTDKCFKAKKNNTGNKKSQNQGDQSNSQTQDQAGDVQMSLGPVTRGSAQYCPSCNTTAHGILGCQGVIQASSLANAETCWKCSVRGHTGDACQNPHAKYCAKCHTNLHYTANCKKKDDKLDAYRVELTLNAGKPTRVFKSYALGNTDFAGTGRALKQVAAFGSQPTFYTTGPTSFTAGGSVSQMLKNSTYLTDLALAAHTQGQLSDVPTLRNATEFVYFEQRLRGEARSQLYEEIREKIDTSRTLYKKCHYNQFIRENYATLIEKHVLLPQQAQYLHFKMAENPGWQFWRDPFALAAVAENKKPMCNNCGANGEILDGWFNTPVIRRDPNEDLHDIRHIEDRDWWGPLVHFKTCTCGPALCSYRFEYRSRTENIDMDGIQQ